MHINRDHRSTTLSYPIEVYNQFIEKLSSKLIDNPAIASCILIGSCAKGTIVPGWSDIDLLLFTRNQITHSLIESIHGTINSTNEKPEIGLTADIIDINQMEKTIRIGAQPIGMIFEVKKYGVLKFGENPFHNINTERISLAKVKNDAKLFINSDIFNWRRQHLTVDTETIEFSNYTCKTYLRCLTRFSAPMKHEPFSYEKRLEKIYKSNFSDILKSSMSLAVNYRRTYCQLSKDKRNTLRQSEILIKNIECLNELL